MARARRDGASRPETFALLLRLLSGQIDGVDFGTGYKQFHTFGAPNGTPFRDFSGEFHAVVSAATGTERALAPGTDIGLEVVRIALNEQYPSVMPTLYPGVMATEPRPFGTLDAMWSAFQVLTNKTPAINGKKCFSLPTSSSGVRSSAPSGPDPLVMGVARVGRLPSRLQTRRVRTIIRS